MRETIRNDEERTNSLNFSKNVDKFKSSKFREKEWQIIMEMLMNDNNVDIYNKG